MADQATRGAARLALLIALPLALVAGLIAFRGLGGFNAARAGTQPSAAPAVQATAPVPMPSRSMGTAEATMCLAFVAHLPPTVRGLAQRPVTAGAEQNAAYGNPAITLSCGGGTPPVAADSFLYTLSGVCWYADQTQPSATVWTTLDRQAPIAVTVPKSYPGPGGWVQEFTATVVAEIPSLAEIPSYCDAPSTAPS